MPNTLGALRKRGSKNGWTAKHRALEATPYGSAVLQSFHAVQFGRPKVASGQRQTLPADDCRRRPGRPSNRRQNSVSRRARRPRVWPGGSCVLRCARVPAAVPARGPGWIRPLARPRRNVRRERRTPHLQAVAVGSLSHARRTRLRSPDAALRRRGSLPRRVRVRRARAVVFAPSLAIEGLFGGAFGRAAFLLLDDPWIDPGAFALVGMGFYGGIAHVPLSALVLVCELAGNYDLLVL